MEDPKARQLFLQVLQKTKAGRITWTPTANDSEFLTVLPGELDLLISKTYERDNYGNPEEQRAWCFGGKTGNCCEWNQAVRFLCQNSLNSTNSLAERHWV